MRFYDTILAALLCLSAKVLAIEVALATITANKTSDTTSTSTTTTTDALGPVSTAMESLAYNTASIADEISLQLSTKLERTAKILSGNIEVILAGALDQLVAPIYSAENKLANGKCQAPWTMKELRRRIDLQLSNCTTELNDLVLAFKSDADESTTKLQQYVQQIAALPATCQLLMSAAGRSEDVRPTFASSSSCFVEQMAHINELVSKELQQVSLLLTRARQFSREGGQQAEQCIDVLVNEVMTLLEKTLADC